MVENHSTPKRASELISVERRYDCVDGKVTCEVIRIVAEFPRGFTDWKRLIRQIETTAAKLYEEDQ